MVSNQEMTNILEEKTSYILLYFAVERDKQVTEDPRYKYLTDKREFSNFLKNITDLSLANSMQLTHREWKGQLAIIEAAQKLKPIYFSIADTKEAAQKELEKSFPEAFSRARAAFCCFSYIKLNEELDTVLVNFQDDNPSSLFRFAKEIITYGTTSYSLSDLETKNNNNESVKLSVLELKQQLINQIKKSTTPGFFNSISNYFLTCCGKSNYQSLSTEEKQDSEGFLQENLFNKINAAHDLQSLFHTLDDFCRDYQFSHPPVVAIIAEQLNGHEFDVVRPKNTSLNNNNF